MLVSVILFVSFNNRRCYLLCNGVNQIQSTPNLPPEHTSQTYIDEVLSVGLRFFVVAEPSSFEVLNTCKSASTCLSDFHIGGST
jgi:hypothetical protein